MYEGSGVGGLIVLSLIGLLIVFALFFPLAFFYSMLFGGFHQSRMFKKLLIREKRVSETLGGDNIHTLSTPINLQKISQTGLVMANISVGHLGGNYFSVGLSPYLEVKFNLLTKFWHTAETK